MGGLPGPVQCSSYITPDSRYSSPSKNQPPLWEENTPMRVQVAELIREGALIAPFERH